MRHSDAGDRAPRVRLPPRTHDRPVQGALDSRLVHTLGISGPPRTTDGGERQPAPAPGSMKAHSGVLSLRNATLASDSSSHAVMNMSWGIASTPEPSQCQRIRTRSPSCEERQHLDQQLSMLLESKAAMREQIVLSIIVKPAVRRTSLVRTNEMIDDVIARMIEHHKRCSYVSLCVQALPSTGNQGWRTNSWR